jgi:hypothetical protein
MSYIPKYILKRMFPPDSFKIVPGGLEVYMINVLTPLSVDNVPETGVEQYVEFNIDGNKISDDLKKKSIVTINYDTPEAKSLTIKEAKSIENVIMPVGSKLKLFVPITNVKKGEEHTFDILIKTVHPFNVQVTRTIC